MVRLSFIIATYNRAEGIVATLRTLCRQTLPKESFEVCVTDNNSCDNTAQCIRRFAEENPGMNIVYAFEQKQGLSHARNCAIRHSSGEILVVVDDDELIDPALAQTYLDFFDAHPAAAAAGGAVVPQYGVELPAWFSPYIDELISGSFDLGPKVKLFGPDRYPRGGNFAIRRPMIEKYGDFNVCLGRKGGSVIGGEEKDLLARLRKGGEKLYYVPGAVITHIIPDAKVTDEYFNRITRMVGVSERIRTCSISGWAYLKRIAVEILKWGATLLLAFGYTLKGAPAKAEYLVRMRWNISRGLLGFSRPDN